MRVKDGAWTVEEREGVAWILDTVEVEVEGMAMVEWVTFVAEESFL